MNKTRELKILEAAVLGLLEASWHILQSTAGFDADKKHIMAWLESVFGCADTLEGGKIGIRHLCSNSRKRGSYFTIAFDEKMLEKIKSILLSLQREVEKGNIAHLLLVAENHDIRYQSLKNEKFASSYRVKNLPRVDLKQLQALDEALSKKNFYKHSAEVRDMVLSVSPISNLGTEILKLDKHDTAMEIPWIFSPSWKSVLQFVKCLLINYHVTSGTFLRVRTCKECGKLHFAHNVHKKHFCSTSCKTKWNHQRQHATKKCLGRQRSYLRSVKNRVDGFEGRIYASECDDCTLINNNIPGGQCPALVQKHYVEFAEYQKTLYDRMHPKLSKSTYSMD